jgi:DNA-binding NarL/FixJ family response regulator
MPKTILIADDNDSLRQALCTALTLESDFEVCGQAHNGQDAIDKAQRLHPDLIILDLSMPLMNGFDAARVIKRLMPSVPMILFTFYVYPAIEAEARAAGVDAVVPKSENTSVLVRIVRGLLYLNAA